ncbi:MAG: hypothetical protein DI570_09985 [Phenylobacterium zucineum]|nr:MAG: hypothetical protein DI570_09985 [Phenylobacterium zucineum]
MPNYLVRLRDSHEIVGIFAVPDYDELLFWIDEVCDPADCEWAPIGSGSIIYPDGGAAKIPLDADETEHDPRPPLVALGDHDLGGFWMAALIDEDLRWEPCVEDWQFPANDF